MLDSNANQVPSIQFYKGRLTSSVSLFLDSLNHTMRYDDETIFDADIGSFTNLHLNYFGEMGVC